MDDQLLGDDGVGGLNSQPGSSHQLHLQNTVPPPMNSAYGGGVPSFKVLDFWKHSRIFIKKRLLSVINKKNSKKIEKIKKITKKIKFFIKIKKTNISYIFKKEIKTLKSTKKKTQQIKT
jgi:hypothetical protein